MQSRSHQSKQNTPNIEAAKFFWFCCREIQQNHTFDANATKTRVLRELGVNMKAALILFTDMLNTPVIACSVGIALNFLMQLLLNGLLQISPCDAPWMIMRDEPDFCNASDGLMALQHLLCSTFLFAGGLLGSLFLLNNKGSDKSSCVICGATLFGSFVQFTNMVLFISVL